jgi:hypothetical protein
MYTPTPGMIRFAGFVVTDGYINWEQAGQSGEMRLLMVVQSAHNQLCNKTVLLPTDDIFRDNSMAVTHVAPSADRILTWALSCSNAFKAIALAQSITFLIDFL